MPPRQAKVRIVPRHPPILRVTQSSSPVLVGGRPAFTWYANRTVYTSDLLPTGGIDLRAVRNQTFTWEGGIRARGPTVAVRRARLQQAVRSVQRTFGDGTVTLQRTGSARNGTELHALFHVFPRRRPLRLRL